MANIQIDTDEIAEIIRPAVEEAVKDATDKMQKTAEIKMLSRQDIMDLFHVSASKGSFIMKQLPKVEGVGHYCVPEHWLRKWIDENTKWITENTGYFGDFEKFDLEVM